MSRYLRKLLTPIPLMTILTSGVTFWVTGVWWIVLLGIAAAAITTMQSVAEESRRGESEEDQAPYALSALDPELREKFRLILKERQRLLLQLYEKENHAFFNPEEIATRIHELVDSYYDLLLKLEKVRPFIEERAMTELNGSIEELKGEIDRCRDAVARENLTLALKSKINQQKSMVELATYKERIESQLVNLLSTLSSLSVRIVQMRLSPDSSIDPTSEIKESINNVLLDVEISEKVTREYQRIISENAL